MPDPQYRADVARELIEAIDALVGYVRNHHRKVLDYFEVVVRDLHPLGERVQVLASALDLASREKPVYNTGGDIQKIHNVDGSLFVGLMNNPTWPGFAQRGRDGPWRFHVMPFDGHPWYEEMAALRKKAEMIAAETPEAGAIPPSPGERQIEAPESGGPASQSMPAEALATAVVKQLRPHLKAIVEAKGGADRTAETKTSRGKGRGKPEAVRKQTTTPASRFTFATGQAFYEGRDLGLPAGRPVDVLKKLVGSWGRTVAHRNLHDTSGEGEASDELRGAIRAIREALRRGKVSYKVDNKRGAGYLIS
jgi:hypothetical protein